MDQIRDGFDVVIIGGGPAGMSAALWCDELGLSSCLVDQNAELGGQLHWIYNSIENHLGAKYVNGADCLERFSESLSGRHFAHLTATVEAIDLPPRIVRFSGGGTLACKFIVIASGVRRRKLGVQGEEEFAGKGILDSGAKFGAQAKGQKIAVIGGGDAALENALILAEHADRVYLIHRRNEFTATPKFVESARSNSKIEIIPRAAAQSFGGNEKLEFVEIKGDNGLSRISINNAVIRIGVEPNTELLSGSLVSDEEGYIVVDRDCQTSEIGIYAIGDVANGTAPTISSAVGMGATAVKSIAKSIRKIE